MKGQENIKRALEIAAAGGHNCILIGPPGAGKRCLPKECRPSFRHSHCRKRWRPRGYTVWPENCRPIVRWYPEGHSVIRTTPSHLSLLLAVVPSPSREISLAHNGVLFLDELPEFQRTVLEVMRQPMEDRKITINRTHSGIEFPASFMLIASMNPCPCGYFNHPDKDCSCPPGAVQKYLQRISGPLMDRIDLHVEVTPLPFADLYAGYHTESSATIRERVTAARKSSRKGSKINMVSSPMHRWVPVYCINMRSL